MKNFFVDRICRLIFPRERQCVGVCLRRHSTAGRWHHLRLAWRRFQLPHAGSKTSQQETPSNIYEWFILPWLELLTYIFAADSSGLHLLLFT